MHLSHTINDQEDGLRRSELSPINVAGCWSTIKGVKGGIFLFFPPHIPWGCMCLEEAGISGSCFGVVHVWFWVLPGGVFRWAGCHDGFNFLHLIFSFTYPQISPREVALTSYDPMRHMMIQHTADEVPL